MAYTIGELAKRSGLTVRSLHHYDDFGLLKPSARSAAGYRLYSEQDVVRLHRILAYRQMGLGLKDIRRLVQAENPPVQAVLERQIAELEAQLARQQRLLARLRHLLNRATSESGIAADELLRAMAVMNKLDDYLEDAELQRLEQRRRELGPEKLQQVRAAWEALIPAVREAMTLGLDPRGEEAQALALRWLQLVRQSTGGDPALIGKLGQMYRQEEGLQQMTGIDAAMLSYLGEAFTLCWPQRERWDVEL